MKVNKHAILVNSSNLFRKLYKPVAFLLVLAIVFSAFLKVFRFKYGDGIYSLDKYYALEDNTVDVLVLGSSHAFEDINPAVLYSEYGIASYDLCGSLQPLWNTYHYLVEALKTQTPKLVILEAYCTSFASQYSDESRIVKNTFGLKPSINSIKALKSSAPKDEFFEYFFRFYRYHSRYNGDLKRSDFHKDQGETLYVDWKGFGCNFDHETFERPNVDSVTQIKKMTAKTEQYYRKIIELCKTKQIPLEIIITPYVVDENAQMIFNSAKEIADEYGVEFINYNSSVFYDKLQFDFSQDMADTGHMNYKGNVKFSRFLGESIFLKYDLPDRRNDSKWASWERNAEYFDATINNRKLKDQSDFNAYVKYVMENPNYTMVVSTKGTNSYYEQIYSNLKKIGIELTSYNTEGIWIRDNKNMITRFDRDTQKPFIQLDNTNIDFSQPDGVKINGAFRKNVERGINIIVYNHITKNVVDTVSFSAQDNFKLIR